MVGMTGLEPAASPPPAVRATNCATSRKYIKPQGIASTLDIPRFNARWVLSKYFHGNILFELPII